MSVFGLFFSLARGGGVGPGTVSTGNRSPRSLYGVRFWETMGGSTVGSVVREDKTK